jgi:hypothetical protein
MKRKDCKRLGCVQPKSSSVWHTGLSGGAPDSVRWGRLNSGEKTALRKSLAAYGYNSPDCPVVHRTVRWANGRLHQRSAAQSSRDAWQLQRSAGGTELSGVHQIVSGAPTGPELQQSSAPEKEGDRHRTVYSDCPVAHPTEGKIGLPCWLPMAPSCLGAIKGVPRRMEESPKLTRNILRLEDSNFAHLILWDSDLCSIWVENSVRCVLSSSCDLCAWLCYDLSLVCVALPSLTSVLLFDHHCKGERL